MRLSLLKPAVQVPPPPAAAYRLTAWPDLPDGERTAAVYQALSRMSHGPVSHSWFLDRTKMQRAAAEALLDRLLRAGHATRIDISGFPAALQGAPAH